MTERERVAIKVVELAKALALADNHFLSTAVGRLRIVCSELPTPMATNGFELAIDPQRICDGFQREREAPKHDLMHSVIHCVFLHPYVGPSIDRRLWNLSCDMTCERVVAELCGSRQGRRGIEIGRALAQVEGRMGERASAEKIYRELKGGAWGGRIDGWEQLFSADSHLPWYAREGESGVVDDSDGESSKAGSDTDETSGDRTTGAQGGDDGTSCEGGPYEEYATGVSNPGQNNDVDVQTKDHSTGDEESDARDTEKVEHDVASNHGPDRPGPGQGTRSGSSSALATSRDHGVGLREVAHVQRNAEMEGWRRVAKSLAVNLETYARARGKGLRGLVGDLEETTHARVDYADFLRQFATPGEVLKVSDDEFDYVYYTYGLSLYGNLPLIEPLEYREEKRIREFVIVIDTSGSVWGQAVRRFIDATFDILKSTEAFFERVHVHIVQCDAAVQSDDVITSLAELKEWGRTMRLHGSGGTDFRPAFEYVDRLVGEGAFENLGGLIYFTDGWGTYPEWMPDYKVAFVFYDEKYRKEIVPPWAAQIVLDDAAIDGGRGIR